MNKATLIYGHNGPLIRFREQQILKGFRDQFGQALNVVPFSKEVPKASQDLSLFQSETRAVYLYHSQEAQTCDPEKLNGILKLEDHFLLLSSPRLTAKSKVVTWVKHLPGSRIYKCYDFSLSEFRDSVSSLCRSRGLEISREAIDFLYPYYGKRMDALPLELEKAALYVAPQKKITVEDLGAIVWEEGPQEVSSLILTLFSDQFSLFCERLASVFKGGHEPIMVVRSLMYHFSILQKIREQMDEGATFDQAASQARPPLLFTLRPTYQQGVRLWDASRIHRAKGALLELETRLKLYPRSLKEIFQQTIASL